MAVSVPPPLALAALALLVLCGAAEARVLLTLDDFGAVGDGIANDTQVRSCSQPPASILLVLAIHGTKKSSGQRAIDDRSVPESLQAFVDAWNAACGSGEQAVLAVPVGKAYRIWPVQLFGPCKKKLKMLPCYSGPRPKTVHFEECRGVSVQGVTLQNGQQFHLTFTRCSDVKASFLRVIAPADSPNTDGVHLNDSSHVQITDNLISTGPFRYDYYVHTYPISKSKPFAVSLGKNRTTDMVENVKVDTCLLTNTTNGVRIKTWQGGMGFARDLRFESIVMKNVSNPIIIDQYYCDQPTPCANQACMTPLLNNIQCKAQSFHRSESLANSVCCKSRSRCMQTQAVEVRKVEFVDIRGTSATPVAISIACSDAVPCRDLELKNVNLTLEGGGGQATASCYRASGKSSGTVLPPSCLAKDARRRRIVPVMARAAAPVPLLLAAAIAAILLGGAEPRTLLTLHDFGAVGDGVTDDTKALADAWAAACAAGDDVILNVPAGKTYQIWPLTLAGPCSSEIKLLISGNIVAPASPSDWGPGYHRQWLHFLNVHDLKVTGGGIIDGSGEQWRNHHCSLSYLQAVHFEDCQGIGVMGITLQNSQRYHLTFTRCSHVEANYLRVTSPEDSVNTNGIHLVDSRNVHIMDNLISTGDDCVSIVGNCTDVRVRAISCGPGHGVDNSIDYVEKIKVDTLFISNAENGVRVRTTKNGGGGFARKVKFESIVMRNVTNPIIVDQGNSDDPEGSFEAQAAATAVQVEKINYIDITGTSASEHAVTFSCSDAMPCRHLSLTNVNLTRVDGRNASSYCRKAYGRSIGTVIPESCLSKEDFVQQAPRHSEEDEEEYSDS
ncbi:hypothetical protein HU200_039654 [Digitaria exilis]|uniref:Polygalacturonase n=1 Tax=Digitaria exilis TaxID=1010633 RepID=A0A835BA79_9POAL|nr:hypothetical protein HU200_039654 [Digitaria exilis]